MDSHLSDLGPTCSVLLSYIENHIRELHIILCETLESLQTFKYEYINPGFRSNVRNHVT